MKRSLLTRRPNSVRILLRAPVRRAIARTLRRHRPVRAQVSLVAVDGAGNRRAAAAAARITG